MKLTYRARVTGGALNLRVGTSVSSERICQIPDGAEVTVTEDLGGWSAVDYDGRSGFVMSRWLEEIRPEPDGETVSVPKTRLEAVYAALENAYDELGDWLGLRG